MKIERLITLTATGDTKAFGKLYEATYSPVLAVAINITGNRHDAEDVAADTFIAIWKGAKGYRGGSGKSWILAIAKNTALTKVKKLNRELPTEYDENSLGGYSTDGRTEDQIVLAAALKTLTDEERETVLLFNSGLKHREIAEIQAQPLGTVTWRYKNALKKLKKYLTEVRYEE